MAVERNSFSRLGAIYSPFATMIRCVRPDQTAKSVTLHYLTDGNSNLRFTIGRQEFLIPLVILLKVCNLYSDY